MKTKILIIFLCLGGCVLLSFLFISFSYSVMIETSSPQFCASCHEIAPAVEAWKTSTHGGSNQYGFKATCIDCHLPPPENTFTFFAAKTKHGLKDVFAHYFGEDYNREEIQKEMHGKFMNENCLRCHSNILYIQSKRGAMLAHREAIYSKPQKSCLECHAPLVHVSREVYDYKKYDYGSGR